MSSWCKQAYKSVVWPQKAKNSCFQKNKAKTGPIQQENKWKIFFGEIKLKNLAANKWKDVRYDKVKTG